MHTVRMNGVSIDVLDPGDPGYGKPNGQHAVGNGVLAFKVSPKGGVSVYGLQRFPVTLYANQWRKLIQSGGDIMAFIDAHASELCSRKGE